MVEACFAHLYEPINHTKPSSKTERHRHLAHACDFQHVQMPLPTLQAILFFGTSLPPKRGAGWGGGAQQQQQKSAAATAAAARARGNEIKTARR
jgi:hypothetical protein